LWAIWPKENAPGFDLSPFHAQSGSEYLLFHDAHFVLWPDTPLIVPEGKGVLSVLYFPFSKVTSFGAARLQNLAASHLRQFGELLAQEVAARIGLHTSTDDAQSNLLRRLNVPRRQRPWTSFIKCAFLRLF
jgi:hypothetical protein